MSCVRGPKKILGIPMHSELHWHAKVPPRRGEKFKSSFGISLPGSTFSWVLQKTGHCGSGCVDVTRYSCEEIGIGQSPHWDLLMGFSL